MHFQIAAFTRKMALNLLNELTPDQLYFIPKGFKNNIIWNIGHILITEQMLTYGLSGLELPVDKKFVELYGKGSIPTAEISSEAIDAIKSDLISASKQTEVDYKNGVFKAFNQYPTSTGIVLTNIDDAIQFNTLHEGIHLGIILAIKKLV